MGGLERDVVVTIMPMPDTLNSPMDFVLLEREVVVPSTTVRGEGVCVAAITILGDDIVEGNETFRVTIQPTNPYDTVPTSGSTANVTIVDDDGTHKLACCHNLTLNLYLSFKKIGKELDQELDGIGIN